MVSSRQQKDIERHMRLIKEARDNGSEEDIRRRTRELLKYLDKEGLRDIY